MFDAKKAILETPSKCEDMQYILSRLGLDLAEDMVALEIGAGSSDLAAFVATRCRKVYATDIRRSPDANYNFDLRNRRKTFNIDTRPDGVEFATVDAEDLIYKDELFDFVYSINAFEHILRPDVAIAEALRVLKPNGFVFFQYDPVWTSPYGHHLGHIMTEPWLHLLLSEKEFERQLRARGGGDYDVEVFRTHMNRWPSSRHYQLLQTICAEQLSVSAINFWDLNPETGFMVDHANYKLALSVGWSPFDLTARGFRLLGRKKEKAAASESEAA